MGTHHLSLSLACLLAGRLGSGNPLPLRASATPMSSVVSRRETFEGDGTDEFQAAP